MYKNIGKKIKGFSIFFAWVVIAASCFGAFYYLFKSKEITTNGIIITVAIIVVGTLVGLFASWFMYGFGVIAQKAEKLDDIEDLNKNILESLDKINFSVPAQKYDDRKDIPLRDFSTPETKNEVLNSKLRRLKKDYEMSRITYDEYEERKEQLEQEYGVE